MARSLLLFENLETTPRRRLFALGGTAVVATPCAWLSPLFWCALGMAISLLRNETSTTSAGLLLGVGYGLALVATNTIHSLGHVLGGRLAGTPPETVLLTATRDVCSFGKRVPVPPKGTRIARALGGPLTNLCVGALALWLGRVSGLQWVEVLGFVNLAIGLWTLCPVPSLDGWVIWGLLAGRRR
jgi:hypothetical protein